MSRAGVGRAEVGRKAVHAGLSLGAAGVLLLLEPEPAATVLAAATFLALAVELARRVSRATARAFARLGPMLKHGEAGRLTGATTLSIGFTIAAVLFPGTPALAGVLFAGLADPPASLVGRRWGRLRYSGGKSVAGSAAFLAVALGLGLAIGLPTGTAVIAAIVMTAAEALSLPIDDNAYLPVLGAAVVAIAAGFSGP